MQTCEIDLKKVSGQSWGFRLQGGKDFGRVVTISKVNAGSPAEKSGLLAGDELLAVGSTRVHEMKHKEVQEMILNGGNCVNFVIARGSHSPFAKHKNLDHDANKQNNVPIQQSRNPFSSGKIFTPANAIHQQNITPMALYSDENIAETLSSKVEVLSGGVKGVNFKKNEKKFDASSSDVLKFIRNIDGETSCDNAREKSEAFRTNNACWKLQHSLQTQNEKEKCDTVSKRVATVLKPVISEQSVIVTSSSTCPLSRSQTPLSAPGSKTTSTTVILKEPNSNVVRVSSSSETETRRYNAFNASPKLFQRSLDKTSTAESVSRAATESRSQLTPGRFPVSQGTTSPLPFSSQQPRTNQTNFQHRDDKTSVKSDRPVGTLSQNKLPSLSQNIAPSIGSNSAQQNISGARDDRQVAPGKGSMADRNQPRRGQGQLRHQAPNIPVCYTCHNQIRGPFITALGNCWCPACFVCANTNCKQSLENIGFVEVDGRIHCEHCWERYFAPTCSKCRKPIKESEECLTAIGNSYHPDCFKCTYCGGLFGNSAFFMEDGLPYCENDWNELFTTKCEGCGFPIDAGDRWVEALEKNYHAQCFKCSVCKQDLNLSAFYSNNGAPSCRLHASNMR